MSDQALAALNARIEQLSSENTSLRAESKKHRLAKRQLSEQLAALKAEHDQSLEDLETVSQGYEELQGQYEASPNEWRTKFEELLGKNRERDHKDAFKRLAAESKVRPDAIEDLYSLTGYKAEGDVDDERIKGLIGEAVKARTWLVSDEGAKPNEAPGGAQRPITTPRREAGPGGGKGLNESRNPSAISQIEADYGDRRPGRLA